VAGVGHYPNTCGFSKADGDTGAYADSVGVSPAVTFGWMAAAVTSSDGNDPIHLGENFSNSTHVKTYFEVG
jgi:hypothetical protein